MPRRQATISGIGLLAFACSLVTAGPAAASDPTLRSPEINLRDLVVDLVTSGITLAPPPAGLDHSAHFLGTDGPQFAALTSLTNDIAIQVASVPLSSSAGGFSYVYDPDTGTISPSSESYGPVYTDRAVTIGRGRFNVGISYNQYTFDSIDDLSLRDGDLYLLFTHEDTNGDGGTELFTFEGDVVTGQLQLKVQSSTTAFVSTYGVTDRFDVGVAIPIVAVDLTASTTATVRRLATGEESDIHEFASGGVTNTFSQSGTATGLGDIVVRGKYRLGRTTYSGLALGLDVRLPTGEERNLQGTGAYQVKGSLIGSFENGSFSPHAAIGYSYNTDDLADEIPHFVGFEYSRDKSITFVADFLGRYVIDTVNVEVTDRSFDVNPGGTSGAEPITATYPGIDLLEGESRYYASGAVGVKIKVRDSMLLTLHGLFALNRSGLTDQFTPLIGIDYSF